MKLSDVTECLRDIVKENATVPLCVWGEAGIGKTSVIKSWCENNNIKCTVTPAAQIQEVGDLLGLPEIKDGKTIYARPEIMPEYSDDDHVWVIDDVNRANNLVLQSFLHLLQFREFGGHKLGKRTYIVMTANPESGDYQVRDLDQAFKTRMYNVEATFDVVLWGTWAKANKMAEHKIKFITQFPEAICGENNIRSWTNGFSTNSEILLRTAVGDTAYEMFKTYENTNDEFKKFNIEDIFDKPENIMRLIQHNKNNNDIKMLMLKRIAMIDLKELSHDKDSAKLTKLFDFIQKLSEQPTNVISGDELLFPMIYWKKFYPEIIRSDSRIFKLSMRGIIT